MRNRARWPSKEFFLFFFTLGIRFEKFSKIRERSFADLRELLGYQHMSVTSENIVYSQKSERA